MPQLINRLGLVSFDRLSGARLFEPLSSLDARHALAVLDAEGCDTILFALGWGLTARVEPAWQSLKHVNLLLFGQDEDAATLFTRGSDGARFFRSVKRDALKRVGDSDEFLKAMECRIINNGLFLFGAELNAFTMIKREGRFTVPRGWHEFIDLKDVQIILNPSSTYMRRWEMKRKRAFLSSRGRTVISLWNRTTLGESALPWTVFQDSIEVTGAARKLPNIDDRITLAILEVPPVRTAY